MKFFLSACMFLIFLSGYTQPKTRRFPNSINNPLINVYAPFISLDGSMILFTSDYASLDPLVYYSLREPGDWKQPVELPKHLNTKLNFLKGYTLSPDGKTVYISSIKSAGVGGYDIWSSDFKNGVWGELKNLYNPINSKGHEAAPTFTPDGTTMYFMRCEKMEYQKASGCKIFVVKKKPNGVWDEPTEMPAHINTGNSQTPRIMADGETLLFSSDNIKPNTGGMDLYSTKLSNGIWSNPIPLTFINTEKDDQFVSALANGRYLLKETPGRLRSEIIEYLIPDEVRPRGVMKIEGLVVKNGAPVPAYISVVELSTKERIFSGRPLADGSFFLFIKEGDLYELAVDPEDGAQTYYTKQYDLTKSDPLRTDQLSITLKNIVAGDELIVDALQFKPYTSDLDVSSTELNRLARLLKSNSGLLYEVQVTLNGYVENTERVDPDLTEETTNTTIETISLTDSIGNVTTRDSTIVKTIYHNNRTAQQANVIVERLVALGVNRDNLFITTNFKILPNESLKNTEVKIIVRQKK
jgi:hypothetical protein